MDWIPVADRLPPIGQNVLVCSTLAVTYHVAYLSPQDNKWHLSFGDVEVWHITHWMELPEMPKESVVILASPTKVPMDQLVGLVSPAEKRQELSGTLFRPFPMYIP